MTIKMISATRLIALLKQLPYSVINFTVKEGKEKKQLSATITEMKILFEDKEYTLVYGENGWEYDGPVSLG